MSIDPGRQTRMISTTGFAREMRKQGVRRGYLVWDDAMNGIKVSHAVLEPLKEYLEKDQVDYDKHEGIFLEAYKDYLFGVFLWRTNRGQGQGGVRFRNNYPDVFGFVKDGIRLATGMGRKSALAGIYWGGGKGIIGYDVKDCADPNMVVDRQDLMNAYGRFVTSLQGMYVAAEDAGISVSDMNMIFQTSRFVTCIDSSLGGSGNPSVPTAHGVICGMEGALDALGMGTLEGKTVAVQGCGNVGGPMIQALLKEKNVKQVFATDIDEGRMEKLIKDCSSDPRLVILQDTDAIYDQNVDILSPCAFGAVLNENTVPRIKAKIICGAANNQLADPKLDYGLTKRGIVYCPDFVVNRMGIVNAANEQYGAVGEDRMEDPIVRTHLGRSDPNAIFNIVRKVVLESLETGKPTNDIAEAIADELSLVPHPIFGHRSKQIIDALVKANKWAS